MPRYELPKGFKVSGIHCGLKKKRQDLGIIFSETPCKAFGVFTRNRVKAAPVLVTQKILKAGEGIRGLIANSGNANCCTGKGGLDDARKMVATTAKELGVGPDTVLVASTGIIGRRIDFDKIKKGIPKAVKELSLSGMMGFAKAILTTDKKRKVEVRTFNIHDKKITITGACKGAGMIQPNMATMLCFIMTDANIDASALKAALNQTSQDTFNAITVDGDMSTNDTVLILANGMAENDPIKKDSKEFKEFKAALYDVSLKLAKDVVRDGEGATKVIKVEVAGAKKEKEAERIARIIANSLLVKTSVHGQDPNWGRVAASAGSSMSDSVDPDKMEIFLDGVCMFRYGTCTNPPPERTARIYKKLSAHILVKLNKGTKKFVMYASDLTKRYIEINAHYTT